MGSAASSSRPARRGSQSPGWGISVDAVVADFIAGAAEQLVLEGVRRGGDVLFVEGQGSLLHPAYSGVTLGLIHGSAPHAYVLCHKADESVVDGDERYLIPPLSEVVDLHERISLLARPARVLAIALNTRDLDEESARRAVTEAEAEQALRRTIRCVSGPGNSSTRSILNRVRPSANEDWAARHFPVSATANTLAP